MFLKYLLILTYIINNVLRLNHVSYFLHIYLVYSLIIHLLYLLIVQSLVLEKCLIAYQYLGVFDFFVPYIQIGYILKRQDRSEEHTSELQSRFDLVCRLLLEKKNYNTTSMFADKIMSMMLFLCT